MLLATRMQKIWCTMGANDVLSHVPTFNNFKFLGLFGKLSRMCCALVWFHDVWICSIEFLEYWMIFSLKIKLNRSWKFQRNWNVPLVLLETSWWAGFGFKMWEILIFKWFLPLKIQIIFLKTRFWKKIQLVTW